MNDIPQMPKMRMDESLLEYAMRFNYFVDEWNAAQTETPQSISR